MIYIERKIINNKPYNYLSEQIKVGDKFKKIQVFIGKNIPNDLSRYYLLLKKKEYTIVKKQIMLGQFKGKHLKDYDLQRIETTRVDWKYFKVTLTETKFERVLRNFAIEFIFESNAIEGSRLSQQEVSKIIRKQYIRKNTSRDEVQEVLNSIEAFEYILSDLFSLNQKSIKLLHALVTKNLHIEQGFKKKTIVVSNRETTDPKNVRAELTKLFAWYKNSKDSEHPFVRAMIFHNRFEHIHPFTDGNGRTGRLILNWMLLREGYGLILFKNTNKFAYRNALGKGDEGRYQKLITFSAFTYRATIGKLINGSKT